jgi:hypothetical protein
MTVRTQQTLRDMWEAGLNRLAESQRHLAEYKASVKAAEDHDRIAAAETQAAKACRTAAAASQKVGTDAEAEANDLADLVNRERAALSLPPLVPGEPYPADLDEPPPAAPPPSSAPEAGLGDLPSALQTARDLLPPVEQGGGPVQ